MPRRSGKSCSSGDLTEAASQNVLWPSHIRWKTERAGLKKSIVKFFRGLKKIQAYLTTYSRMRKSRGLSIRRYLGGNRCALKSKCAQPGHLITVHGSWLHPANAFFF